MKKERPVINQQMCRMVELMIKGGAPTKEITEQMGISGTTISRIRRAGFDAKKYEEDKNQRLIMEKTMPAEDKKAPESEVPGQLQMKLTMENEKAIEQEISTETKEMSEQVKMMRFQAAQVDKLIMKLDQIYNMASMLLRAVRKE